MASFVLTVIGDDQSGLVDALSGVIARHKGNWDRSHMARVAGKFAGILLVSVPDGQTDQFLADLRPLESNGLLDITVDVAGELPSDSGSTVVLDLVGTDRPGIVHDVSHALATGGVGIIELETHTSTAPMAGGMLFHAHATLLIPDGADTDALIDDLERLAGELMVDIDLAEGDIG